MDIVKGGNRITSLDDWSQWAPPKGGAAQWVDGRSAKGFARACCETDGVITQVQQLL
jgi:hypothetical protein